VSTLLPPPPLPDELAERYPSIVKRIARERFVRKGTAARWLHETLKFLDLCATSDVILVPSKRVDHAWHVFILHTREYDDWCRQRYGEYVHHTPTDETDLDAYRRTLDLLEERFGGRDRKVWPRPKGNGGGQTGAGCGGSCGSGADGGGSGCGGGCGGGGS
jgi:uncharacterized membrane protein YgcG